MMTWQVRPRCSGSLGDSLVEQVIEHARAAGPFTGREAIDPAILELVRELPREAFVAPEAVPFAYLDVPLPALHGLREVAAVHCRVDDGHGGDRPR